MRVRTIITTVLATALIAAAVVVVSPHAGGATMGQAAASPATATVAPDPDALPPRPYVQPPRVERITITAVGDLMAHSQQYKSAATGGGAYDFTPVFVEVAPYLADSDIAVGNLETVLGSAENRGYSGYPMFNTPDEYATALKGVGFDVLTTANNHSLDRGASGAMRTLDVLDHEGVWHTGSSRSADEQSRLLYLEIRDVKIGFLAYTYGTNGLYPPSDKPWIVNYIDTREVLEDVAKAQAEDLDLLVVSVHQGVEYVRTSGAEQERLHDALAEAGVDVILGSHPHVLQPMRVRTVVDADGSERKVFEIDSLGNFVSAMQKRYCDAGIIVHMSFVKDFQTGETTLESVAYTPTWVDQHNASGASAYRVLPIADALRNLEAGIDPDISSVDAQKLRQAWGDTVAHMGNGAVPDPVDATLLFYETDYPPTLCTRPPRL